MTSDIRAEIAERRAEDIGREGASQGVILPAERNLPLIPFLADPAVICEVKRKSPSVQDIDLELDPVKLAAAYQLSGIRSISVLTEQNFFAGSLEDLYRIKKAFPECSVLRKDFLLTEEDVDVSFRAGADAFLLIASLLESDRLRSMYELGLRLGMTPLVELHGIEDVRKAAVFKPELVGINSRDLRIFRIKPLQPLRIRAMINWNCRIVYESGIKTGYDIDFVKGTGFDAVLVGEAAVRDAAFARKLAAAFSPGAGGILPDGVSGVDRFGFWKRLYSRCRPGRPLVKICGITSSADLQKICDLGADAAGFVLADSPRRVAPSFIESCRNFDILKIGVVVLASGEPLPEDISALLESGALDAVQFHGDEQPSDYLSYPGYKAVRVKDKAAADYACGLPGPALLIDAFSKDAHGGTGRRIEPELVADVAAKRSLWLAGGIRPENVGEIIREFSPEMIDISSGVEKEPGLKDHARLEALFQEIQHG